MITCEGKYDPYHKALDLEIDNYSAMIAIGGDGTFSEMVNGMLSRPDNKRVPVGLIPTGQCNDMGRSLNQCKAKISRAIDAIALGEAVPVDTTRVLIDHDSEANLPEGVARLKYCRHMVSNSSLSMPAKLADGASSFRGVCGASAFSFMSFMNMMSCGFVQEQY